MVTTAMNRRIILAGALAGAAGALSSNSALAQTILPKILTEDSESGVYTHGIEITANKDAVLAALSYAHFLSVGNGTPMFIHFYSTCPYARMLYRDYGPGINGIQMRWIPYPAADANRDQMVEALLHGDAVTLRELMQASLNAPDVMSSQAKIDLFNQQVITGDALRAGVVANNALRPQISPTFYWSKQGRLFFHQGYGGSPVDRKVVAAIVAMVRS